MIRTANLTGSYLLDAEQTRVGFKIRQTVSKVPGQFEDFEGSIYLDGDDPSRSTARLAIRADSIRTGNKRRDAHLRTAFLDTAAHPAITFTSSEVEQLDETTFKLTGALTIRGVTRPVAVAFRLTAASDDQVAFEGEATINRQDWGVAWNAVAEGAGALVSNMVTLTFTVLAIRQP